MRARATLPVMRLAAAILSLGLAACGGGEPNRPLSHEELSAIADTVMPRGWFGLLSEGTVLRAQRDYTAAIALFEKGARAYPDYPDAHRELAATLDESARPGNDLDAATKTARLEAAATHYEKALDLGAGKDSTSPWNQLIGLYDQGLERVADAERIARRMTSERSEMSDSWENLARLLEKQGRAAEAAQALLDGERRVTRLAERQYLAGAMLGLEDGVPPVERLRLLDAAIGIAEEGLKAKPGEPAFPKLKAKAREARDAARQSRARRRN